MPKPDELAQLVFFLRSERVMLDADLTRLYGVSTKALNQPMSRNKDRFSHDLAFRLTSAEFLGLLRNVKCLDVTPSR
jgi:hypothetical protein